MAGRRPSRATGVVMRFLRGLHDHFLPHARNGHVPHVLGHRVLFGYATVLVLVKVLAVIVGVVLPSSSLYSSAVTPENIVRLTNEARRAAGVTELEVSVPLARAAQAKARDMLAHQYFAHTSPGGVTPWSWIRDAGYAYRHAGENLAINFLEAEDVEAGWMASPSHQANVVDPRYEDIGVAVLQGQYQGKETFVVVQMFGTPKAAVAAGSDGVVPAAPATTATEKPPAVSEPALAIALAPTAKPAAQQVAGAKVPAPQLSRVDAAVEAAALSAPAAEPEPGPQIDGASVTILPSADGYAVSVEVTDAVSVAAHLGDRWATLAATDATGTRWTGVVPAPAVGTADAFIVATSKEGQQVASPVAWVAPGAVAATAFAPAVPQRQFRLFGLLTVEGLEDRVRQFYVAAMAVLAGALLVSVMAKFHVQRHAMLVHCLAVMFLAGMLAIA
jgi:hypothetical protein